MNYNKLCGISISRLHLSSKQFYELTPVELVIALKDQREREKESLEVVIKSNEHNAWETTRTLLLHLYSMNPYVKKRPKKASEVFSLPWDNDNDNKKVQTVEQMASVLREIHRNNAKKLKKLKE